jgi:hypothetical protein
MSRFVLLLTCLIAACASAATPPTTGPSRVAFDPDGIVTVNGERFFPIGCYVYELTPNVMADLHEHRFNTIIGNGFKPDQFDFMHKHGIMGVPFSTPEFLAKVKDHPSLLAWYLVDEPEGAGNHTPEAMKTAYEHLKAKDPNHPIGVCNYLWEALEKFKSGSDFTMTDVYPIVAARDGILENVGKFIDEARRIHGPNWPHWAYIQDFGGPDTEGGKWAQPLPHEVRAMTFDALVHRATGIMYFSYWPKAPVTWASITELNQDIERIVPWILAKDGKEIEAKSSEPAIHVRARQVGGGTMILAVNVLPRYFNVTIDVKDLSDGALRLPYENREKAAAGGKFTERFDPFEAKVYLAGPEALWP